MEVRFKGKGLFVFSDPGAAKAILAFARQIKESLSDIRIISDRVYGFVPGFGFEVFPPSENIIDDIANFSPSFIFTGTSYTSKIELDYIRFGNNCNLPTFSFIDHWTSFLKRFESNGSLIYPDKIFVIDERAKSLAIQEGLPKAKLEIFDNPYYKYLKEWKPQNSKESFLKTIGVKNTNKKIAVFAPEPLSNVNGISRFGFDEIESMQAIKKILDKNEINFTFLFKPHPNQDMNKIKKFISKKIILLNFEIDTNELIYYSDLVIGFFSNFLIEASIMNKKILRFHVKPIKEDPIAELNIGKIVDSEKLTFELT